MHICSAALSLVCFLRPATLAFVSFFVVSILADQLQEKPNYGKIISPLWAHCETQGFFGDSRVNFTARSDVNSSKLSKRWLAQWSENPVEGIWVCLRSKRFFSALFPRVNFFAWSRLFKELPSNCLQIWTVARLTYKKQTCVCELFISKYFFSESDFCTITSQFLNPISIIFCNFLLQLNMAKRRHAF